MSGVGFWELILVFLIGLIVLGPERLPRVASQLGTWLGQARRMTRAMKRQLEDELNLEQEMTLRPRTSRLPPPQAASPAKPEEEQDDTYSPAHDIDAVGTGVGQPDREKGDQETDAAIPADNVRDAEPDDSTPPEKTT